MSRSPTAANAATISRTLTAAGFKKSTGHKARNVSGMNVYTAGFTVRNETIMDRGGAGGRETPVPIGEVEITCRGNIDWEAITTLLWANGYVFHPGRDGFDRIVRLDTEGQIIRPEPYKWAVSALDR